MHNKEINKVVFVSNTQNNFDITSYITNVDKSKFIDSMNNGKLRPSKNIKISNYNVDVIYVSFHGEKSFNIYNISPNNFIVEFPTKKGTLDSEIVNYTKINSNLLQYYFNKFKNLCKNVIPYK